MFLREYLIERMRERGENKTQFAEAMGLYPTQLARILNNTTEKLPTNNILEKLSVGLEISKDDLVKICKEGIDSGRNNLKDKKVREMKEAFPYDLQNSLTIAQIAKVVCSHDEIIYRLQKEFAGEPEQWGEIMSNFPQSTKLFYYEEESETLEKKVNIIGDCSFVFINDKKMELFIDNNVFKDEKIKMEYLLPMTIPGEYNMYILNMSLINQYSTPDNIQQVIRSFLERIEALAQRKIFIKSVYVNVYRRDVGFYETIGFKKETKYTNQEILQDGRPCLYELKNFIKDFEYNDEKERLQRIKEVYEERGIDIDE